MKKFRGQVVLTLITKPLVVEAETEADAYEMLKDIPDSKLLEYIDSVATEVYNRGGREQTIVRVSNAEPTTYEAPTKKRDSEKLDELIEILKRNADDTARLLEAKQDDGK